MWSSIRPWIPPLTLSVREITSVSVTFMLSAAPSDETDTLLQSLGLDDDDSDDELKKACVVSSALAGGLSVDVDRAAWRRVFIRIDDKTDEAVIIIYGLMPGRQYDVDLELVQGGQKNRLERRVVTAEHPPLSAAPDSSDIPTHAPDDTPPSEALACPPSPATPVFTPLTIEDRLNQLQHTLAVMAAERDSLSSTLKAARRDGQKADASVRAEMETLKRASEKHTAVEHRAKQKVLALQEAVKRAQSQSQDIDEQAIQVEATIPDLLTQRELKEDELKRVREGADRIQKLREAASEKERRRLETMTAELTAMANKLERLHLKKDKMESSTIPDLEDQLRAVELEIETEMQAGLSQTWNNPPRHAHTQRSSSLHVHKPPIVLQNPHRQSSLKATSLSSRAPPFEPGRPIRSNMWNMG